MSTPARNTLQPLPSAHSYLMNESHIVYSHMFDSANIIVLNQIQLLNLLLVHLSGRVER
jgi:hypothetical protein